MWSIWVDFAGRGWGKDAEDHRRWAALRIVKTITKQLGKERAQGSTGLGEQHCQRRFIGLVVANKIHVNPYGDHSSAAALSSKSRQCLLPRSGRALVAFPPTWGRGHRCTATLLPQT